MTDIVLMYYREYASSKFKSLNTFSFLSNGSSFIFINYYDLYFVTDNLY